jgi:hypothetical protein
VKSAFTREYNKTPHKSQSLSGITAGMVATIAKGKRGAAAQLSLEDEEEAEEEEGGSGSEGEEGEGGKKAALPPKAKAAGRGGRGGAAARGRGGAAMRGRGGGGGGGVPAKKAGAKRALAESEDEVVLSDSD